MLADEPRGIASWLRVAPKNCRLAIEVINAHNIAVATLVYKHGHRAYVVDGCQQRGPKKTEALIILSRKLTRVAFALIARQQP